MSTWRILETAHSEIHIIRAGCDKMGKHGNGDGQFNLPVALPLDGSGNVYVTDTITTVFRNSRPPGSL